MNREPREGLRTGRNVGSAGCAFLVYTFNMSRSLQFDLSAIFEAIRTNRYVQVGLVAVGVGAAAALWLWRPYVRLGLSASKSFALEFLFGSREQQLLEHVKKNAVKGDPESVLETIDKYCWDNHWMMHIGDEKGKILDAEVKKAQPKVRRAQ